MQHGVTLGSGYQFSWEILRLFLEGFSPIDLTALPLLDEDEAGAFLKQYGYDLDKPEEAQEVDTIYQEALGFIERFLCPAVREGDCDLKIPEALREQSSAIQLLLWASDRRDPWLAAWSCATLRVMHTMSHADRAVRTPYYDEVKEQILGRFQQHIFREDERLTLGRGPAAVRLRAVFYKEQKSRNSLILKLLHKPHNVASEVYDRIGVKLITPSKAEALLALKYLRKANLVSIPHITPGRSRNTLVDLERFRIAYESLTRLTTDPGNEQIRDIEFVRQLQHRPEMEAQDVETRIQNPFSGRDFRNIQFTCRHLVKVPNPAFGVLEAVRSQVQDPGLLAGLEAQHPQTLRFYFPYEVQITDHENFLVSLEGESSHSNYKRRQLQAARTRVLGQVVRLTRAQQCRQLAADAGEDGPVGKENCGVAPE